MGTNGSTEARKLRSRLNHPIVDADGHWLEYGPVMRDEFRRIGGDAAVEALAAATDRVPSALRMSLPERRRRRVGMEAFWGSPSENVLDRATAMLPRLMYERLDDLGLDFCVVYPTTGLGFHRMQDTRLRRAICRAYNVFTADQFRGLEDRVIPAAIIPMYTPEEAIEELEFASKQLGYKVDDGRRAHAAQGHGARRGEPGRVEGRRLVRRDRDRQRPRLRFRMGEVPRAQGRAELPQRRALDPPAQLAVELLLQPHRPLRLRRPRGGQGHVPRRRDAALPEPELRLPRGRRGLGVHALRRPDRPLGEAQPAGDREHESEQPRPPRAARARAEVRARGGGGSGAARRGARGRLQLDR